MDGPAGTNGDLPRSSGTDGGPGSGGVASAPGGPAPGGSATSRTAPRATLQWLEAELAVWQAQGLVDAEGAHRIRSSYTAGRRVPLGRLMLLLGAAFVAVGVLWLVAANLEQLSPTTRFVGVTVLWLSAVVLAEVLAGRDRVAPAAVGAARLVAAVVFGGVVFQAAQSLQVPAYAPGLLGWWAAGALLYAYACAGAAPLVVGVLTAVGWCLWTVADRSPSGAAAVVVLLLAGALATALAAVHTGRRRSEWSSFAGPWRAASAGLVLVGLFVLALPGVVRVGEVPGGVGAAAAAVVVAAALAAVLSDRTGRLEVAVTLGVLAAGALLLQWRPTGPPGELLAGADLLRAAVLLTVYVAVCVWFAALGVLRDADRLTSVATGALVVFTVVQSFAVFSTILSGAALFLALGAVLVVVGALVGSGRRRLVADVREVAA